MKKNKYLKPETAIFHVQADRLMDQMVASIEDSKGNTDDVVGGTDQGTNTGGNAGGGGYDWENGWGN